MYNFILKKDLSNIDTSSLLLKQNGEGRIQTHGNIDHNVFDIDQDNTIQFDKIINTCNVRKYFCISLVLFIILKKEL